MAKPITSERLKRLRVETAGRYRERPPVDLAHVLRVSRRGMSERQCVVGLLHDAPEDGVSIRSLDLTPDEVRDIYDLTRDAGRGETTHAGYGDYIARLCRNATMDALTVKLYDLLDHLDPARTDGLTPGLMTRYLSAMGDIITEMHRPQRDVQTYLRAIKTDNGWLARRHRELMAREDGDGPAPV